MSLVVNTLLFTCQIEGALSELGYDSIFLDDVRKVLHKAKVFT